MLHSDVDLHKRTVVRDATLPTAAAVRAHFAALPGRTGPSSSPRRTQDWLGDLRMSSRARRRSAARSRASR